LRKVDYETSCPRIKKSDHFVLRELAKNSKVTQLEKFEEILQFYIDNTKEEK